MKSSDNPFQPVLPDAEHPHIVWGQLHGASEPMALASLVASHPGFCLIVTEDAHQADLLSESIAFFEPQRPVPVFPDWETLPYDLFSPHEDIVSERIRLLTGLPHATRGALIVAAPTLMTRLPPRSFLAAHGLQLRTGQRLDVHALRQDLEAAGYQAVTQVYSHGEFALRGAILDLFPTGSETPYRIDLFDDEVESIRAFDPETQRSGDRIEAVELLPAHEYPFNEDAIRDFRHRYRSRFEGDPRKSLIYRDVSQGHPPAGIEYYLPLFFEAGMATLFDYLPEDTLIVYHQGVTGACEGFWHAVENRYEERRHDLERPLLEPQELFLPPEQALGRLRHGRSISWSRFSHTEAVAHNFNAQALPTLRIQPRQERPAAMLEDFLARQTGRVLFTAESPGRREYLVELLRGFGIRPRTVDDWPAFLAGDDPVAVSVSPIEEGLLLREPPLAIIPETLLVGERARQTRRRARPSRDADAIIRNLTDLREGSPVVHEDHGVGRYLGLQTLAVGGATPTEFLLIEYAGGDKLYVPVASLHLVSRYTGTSEEQAPLHKLGGEQWARIRRRAAEKIRDVAAELLDVQARRAARQGYSFVVDSDEYAAFAAAFPFEETEDQETAIKAVLADMAAGRPMDRVVCGDVGFGKTEVAMRAAFVAAHGGKQVAVLVPTTLLAQQHTQNFRDRFADWPVRIESLSRFRTAAQTKQALAELAAGRIDIIIGTHKLLQDDVKFKELGLVIIDEEHRFGVRHKEKLKSLRAQVDVLTLTATPIPRTLNMTLAGMRDLSIIATPPVQRHAIKTFVSEWSKPLIQEAAQRELRRGGQVYFLHNEVKTIEKMARELGEIIPEASIAVAHGQMAERELEHIMLDFYHQRTNLLVCTTIIESGIDIPTANTIIINRADKLGLAQLHQLRGRVGRSHHRAFAYLITPPRKAMTPDAVKRLEAIESLEELGVGFTLATHDMEIRGAGELLGEDQSGEIQEIGFTLYNEMLERAVQAMREGRMPNVDQPINAGTEVELGVPALLPEDYVPDVHTRLILYKRIAAAASEDALRDIQIELIDRFGLLPEPAKHLFEATELRLKAQALGIRKIETGPGGGRIRFNPDAKIDPARLVKLVQSQPNVYRFDGAEKLRITRELPDTPARIAALHQLMDTLRLEPLASNPTENA
ncbi:MAG: transcription-repair coupling factor [Gammaproteobacteria bacterium]